MSGSVVVCELDKLEPNSSQRIEVDGRYLTVVRFLEDEVYVLADRCSHADFSLAGGMVDCDDKTIECPKHGALFSTETGDAETLPATQPVATYQATVENGQVKVALS